MLECRVLLEVTLLVCSVVDESGALVCHSLCKGSYSIRKVASDKTKQGVFARDRSGQQQEVQNSLL